MKRLFSVPLVGLLWATLLALMMGQQPTPPAVTISGTPSNGQAAEFTAPRVLQGVNTTGTGLAVRDTSPTLTTPTIASFANATHTHQDATGGGQLSGAALLDNTVTYAKLTDLAASKLLGRGDSGAGDPQEITLGTNLSMAGTTLNATAGGSGTINAGTSGRVARYTGGTELSDSTALTLDATDILTRKDKVTAVSADTSLGGHNLLYCTAGATERFLTLPAAASATAGTYRVIKADTGAGACTVKPTTGERINGTVNGTSSAAVQWAMVEVTLVDITTPNWHASSGLPTFGVTAQSATYSVTPADFAAYRTLVVTTGTGTFTLPSNAPQPPNGQFIRVLNYGSGVITIARNGQNINGGTSSLTLPAASATAPTMAWVSSDGTHYVAALSGGTTGSVPGTAGQTLYTNGSALAASSGQSFDSTSLLSSKPRATTVSASKTLGTSDGPIVTCDASGGAVVLTLPGASSTTQGQWLVVKTDSSANACSFARGGSDTINGGTTNVGTTTQWGSVDAVLTSSTNWSSVATGGGGVGDFSSNTATSVDSELVLFSGTSGKTGKRATGTGIPTLASGVLSTPITASAGLAAALSDETGSGALVFGTSPTLTTPTIAKLANLTTNGFVTTSGGNGTLGVDTTTYASASSTTTFTNKTLDVEGTGNSLTTVSKVWLPAAACAGTAGSLLWDTLASNAPTATCSAGGTETTLMRGVADFPDSDGDYSLQQTLALPADWTGAIDAKVKYRTTATSGNTVWQIATVCIADAEVDDAAFNTATAFSADAAKGTTNQTNDASATGITTTGCAAGELMHVKVFRNRTHASDTITGVVSLIGVELTLRRAQ